MLNILITGASGMLAKYIIQEVVMSQHNVLGLSSTALWQSKNLDIDIISNDDFSATALDSRKVDVVVHAAFTRDNKINSVIEAVEFSNKVFCNTRDSKTKKIINLSSRSVYIEPEKGQLNSEDSPIGGGGYIGMGKAITERMLESVFKNSNVEFTSLRISSINETRKENTLKRPINIFVQKVIKGENIELVGGDQVMSYIDPRDVASAVMAVINYQGTLRHIYNVGTGYKCTRSLREIAQLVVEIGKNEYGFNSTKILINPSEIIMNAGLNIERIKNDIGWEPMYTLEDMIKSVYELYL